MHVLIPKIKIVKKTFRIKIPISRIIVTALISYQCNVKDGKVDDDMNILLIYKERYHPI
jgi:hypothetical protein